MKKIIGVVMVAVCVMLVGCGQSAQEKVVEEAQHKVQILQYEAYSDPIPSLKSAPPGKVVDWNAALNLKPADPIKK